MILAIHGEFLVHRSPCSYLYISIPWFFYNCAFALFRLSTYNLPVCYYVDQVPHGLPHRWMLEPRTPRCVHDGKVRRLTRYLGPPHEAKRRSSHLTGIQTMLLNVPNSLYQLSSGVRVGIAVC